MLGAIGCNRGHLLGRRGALAEATLSYEQAEAALLGALAAEPENSTAITYWYNTASGRIDALERAGRLGEALEYCQGVQAVVPGRFAPTFRLRLAYFAARNRDHALSKKTLDALGDPEFDDSALLNIAGIHAINAATVQAEDAGLCAEYQQEALRWLRKRLDRGNLDRREFEDDEDFAALRGLQEYQRLLTGAQP